MVTCDIAPVSATWVALGFASLAVIGLMLLVAFCRWLQQLDVRIVGPISGFLHRPVGEVLVVLVCVGGIVRYGATKGTNGCDRNLLPSTQMACSPVLHPLVEGVSGLEYPSDSPPVTNLCFWGLFRTDDSVELGIAWPDGMSFTNGYIDLFGHWQLASNGWWRLAQIDVSGVWSNAVVRIEASDFPTNAMEDVAFFRLASQDDADGDGLTDKVEEWTFGTNPDGADTDGDGMPDGWEVICGLNPCVDDASADADDDGLSNREEFAAGTDPLARDTDGDGLEDADEGSWIDTDAQIPWFDLSDGTVICSDTNCGSGVFVGRLPFTKRLAGLEVSRFVADIEGLIRFADSERAESVTVAGDALDLSSDLDADDVIVAPYWTNMYFLRSANSRLVSATKHYNGQTYFVLEYDNFALGPGPVWTVSFQISFPQHTPADVVYVRYGPCVDDRNDTFTLSIGAQGPHGTCRMPYHYGIPYIESTWSTIVTNGMAFAYHFNHDLLPLDPDSDGDGLLDGWEVVHGFDPLYDWGDDDGYGDPDEDGLINVEEQTAGTDPRSADTDGDGMDDRWEFESGTDPLTDDAEGDLDGDGLSNLDEYAIGGNPLRTDTDLDGIPDATERAIGTSLDQPDTDGDGMDDGWEHDHGFDPTEDNDGNGDPTDDSDADPDHDGLTNAEECEHRTNPHAADTDDDGVNDGTEVAQGSDPLDPSDDGVPDGRTVISFHFGDPSDSHSEKYRLSVTPVSGPGDRPVAHSWSDTWYGVCETKSASLKNGWKYEVRLDHVSTDPHYDGMPNPDYDYELSLPSRPSNVVLVDPQGLFGVDGSSERFGGEGKVACVYALGEPTVLAPKAMGVNNDDDNGNDTPDGEEDGAVSGDDDLAEVTVSLFCPDDLSGTVTVTPTLGATSATLWRDRSRSVRVETPDSFAVSGGTASRTYYLEGSNPSSAYLCERISAELRCGSAVVTNEHRFTVIERIAEPITTESRGGEVVNPCCAIVGSGTPLRVSVLPESFPDSEIRWRTVSGPGTFSDATGRDATFATSGAEGAQTVVQVDCGDCPGRAPQFTLQAATMHEVKVYPCAVSRVGRTSPITTAKVNALLDEVNVIFRQVGLHFSLGAGVSNVANSVWARDGLTDISLAAQIRNIMSGTDGVEVYFIPGNGNGPIGQHARTGIIIRDSVGATSLAHELGHVCGLHDIDAQNDELTEGVKESWMPQDWNNGTGCRFYDPMLMQRDAVRRLLMFGYESAAKADIPSGGVYGKTSDSTWGLMSVGLNGILTYSPRSL